MSVKTSFKGLLSVSKVLRSREALTSMDFASLYAEKFTKGGDVHIIANAALV
jgi:hypothetical protein